MGKTKFEKYLESIDNNKRDEILNNIKHLFINEMKTDEEIGNILNISKTAIKNVRFKYGIVKKYSDIFNDNAKRNAQKYINNELNGNLTRQIFMELPLEYQSSIITNIQNKINEIKYSQRDLINL